MAVFVWGDSVYLTESTGKVLAVIKAGFHSNVYNGKICGTEQIGGMITADGLDIFYHGSVNMSCEQLC